MQYLTINNVGSQTRTYRDENGVLQAYAVSQDEFNTFVNYYCLAGVWEPQCNTQIVSGKELVTMYLLWTDALMSGDRLQTE